MRSNQSQLNKIEKSAFPTRTALSQKEYGCDLCDLHIHTTASDGSFTPFKVVKLANTLGLRAISLCDHDTLLGYLQIAEKFDTDELGSVHIDGIEVIPGIEMSTKWHNRELHILGYFVEPSDFEFSQMLTRMRQARIKRTEGIIEKLNALNMPLEMKKILQFAQGDSVGRPHIAQAMVSMNYCATVKEAFDLYLNPGQPCFVPKLRLTPFEAIAAIQSAKGIPVWAHPRIANADFLLDDLIAKGLKGIEVYHPKHCRGSQLKYLNLAKDKNLLVTGGSDFHSPNSEEDLMIGDFGVNYKELEIMKSRARQTRM